MKLYVVSLVTQHATGSTLTVIFVRAKNEHEAIGKALQGVQGDVLMRSVVEVTQERLDWAKNAM